MDLHKTDLRILELLEEDARLSQRQIAKKIKTSQERIHYRIKRLEDLGIIEGYTVLLNRAAMGSQAYYIMFDFSKTTREDEKEIIEWLQKKKGIRWILEGIGVYQVVCYLYTDKVELLYSFLNEFKQKFGDRLGKIDVLTAVHNVYGKKSFLYGKKENSQQALEGGSKQPLEEIDVALLKALEKDGRASLTVLGEALGASSKVVAYHLKKLKRQNVLLQSVPIINMELLGYQYHYLLLNISSEKNKNLLNYLQSHPHITFISELLGKYQVSIDVVVKDTKALVQFIVELKHSFGNIILGIDSLHIHSVQLLPSL